MLAVEKIAKGYADRQLFAGVSWTVPARARVGLVGKNGSGKSTFLKILAGACETDAGRVIRPRGFTVGYLAQEIDRQATGSVLEETLQGGGEVPEIERRLAALADALGDEAGDETMQALLEEQATLHERIEHLDGYALEARARRILSGLGFSPERVGQKLGALSGGWVMRVHLARLLLAAPDLLLLDEPTNHLDLESLLWLEDFLEGYRGGWMVVSHDRTFLDRRVETIVQVDADGLLEVPGNYRRYLDVIAERDEHAARVEAKTRRKIEETRRFVDRFRAQATKARQVQSRLKALQKIEAGPGAAGSSRRTSRTMAFRLPDAPRTGAEVLKLEGIHKAYEEARVYEGLDFVLHRGERVALVGVNGAGKSTLLKILAGTLSFERGERVEGHAVQLFAYAQHQAEALPKKSTVLAYLTSFMPQESETRVRTALGAFLFHGDDVEKRISVLSGGEKARLALASILARPVNCLLLDEPTSHLDLESREVLEQALESYRGALVCISHDRFFVNRICTQVVEVRPGGKIARFPGDYDDYLRKRAEEASGLHRQTKTAGRSNTGAQSEGRSPVSKAERLRRRQAEREAKRSAERASRDREQATQVLLSAIEGGEARIVELDALLCSPEVLADPKRLAEASRERGDLSRRIPGLYARLEEME